MVGNEADKCHTVDEEMENVPLSSSGLDIDSERDMQIVKVPSGTPSCSRKNGADTDGELASHAITNSSVNKNVISLDDERHEMDTIIERGNESSSGHLNGVSGSDHYLGKDDNEEYDAPQLGKEFESEDHAYKSYLKYASLMGFGVRKDFVNKNYDGVVVSRRFTCSKEGHRRPKRGSITKNPREDTRTGCLAHMTVSRQANGRFRVRHFETNHNHELETLVTEVSPLQTRINFPQDGSDQNVGSLEDKAPKLGMKFESEDHAYEYYNVYAGLAGFSIRKDYVNKSKKDGGVSSRRFICCRGGSNNKEKNGSGTKRPRKELRIGCLAQLIIVRRSDRRFHVHHYEGKHNHELVPACRISMLRTQKRLAMLQTVEELDSASSDRPIGDGESMTSNPVDSETSLPRKRKHDMKEGEPEAIFQYFLDRKKQDPSLYYAVQLDAEGQMANVFWADGKMVADYHYFGDVLGFDTTYKLDKDCRPFVSFTGVNHHKQLLIFGAGVLYDETFESFKWLFRTFLKVMFQKKPKTILTEQDDVLAEAIKSVLPDAHHRLCAWHMYQKALKSISEVTPVSDCFPVDLKSCFFNHEEEEDFVQAWETMLRSMNLWENEELKDIFRDKEKWAMPYRRHVFCADIKFAQLSENFLPKVRKYIKSGLDILSSLKKFTKLLNDWRYNELQANYDMGNQLPRLIGDVIMLKRVRDLYTPKIFELFQQEYETSLDFVVNQCNENVPQVEFKVGMYGQGREYTVTFNSSENSVTCSCMKYQFEGNLCSHTIKVLDYRNIKVVPTQYILKRWTRTATI